MISGFKISGGTLALMSSASIRFIAVRLRAPFGSRRASSDNRSLGFTPILVSSLDALSSSLFSALVISLLASLFSSRFNLLEVLEP